MLRFHHLQEALRKLLWERIESGELTGAALAEQTGFRQAHISNFLNRKRGLSLKGLDRVLAAEEISLLDLVPSDEIDQRASIPPPQEDEYVHLLLVPPNRAMLPQVQARDVLEVVKFKEALLRRLRTNPQGIREDWLRFVMMKPTRADCEAMYPRLAPGCMVLIDRHYNALKPYRRGERTMYAVLRDGEAMVRYVTLAENTLLLRPQSHKAEVLLLPLGPKSDATDRIIGRIAHVSLET